MWHIFFPTLAAVKHFVQSCKTGWMPLEKLCSVKLAYQKSTETLHRGGSTLQGEGPSTYQHQVVEEVWMQTCKTNKGPNLKDDSWKYVLLFHEEKTFLQKWWNWRMIMSCVFSQQYRKTVGWHDQHPITDSNKGTVIYLCMHNWEIQSAVLQNKAMQHTVKNTCNKYRGIFGSVWRKYSNPSVKVCLRVSHILTCHHPWVLCQF